MAAASSGTLKMMFKSSGNIPLQGLNMQFIASAEANRTMSGSVLCKRELSNLLRLIEFSM